MTSLFEFEFESGNNPIAVSLNKTLFSIAISIKIVKQIRVVSKSSLGKSAAHRAKYLTESVHMVLEQPSNDSQFLNSIHSLAPLTAVGCLIL